MQKRLHRSFLLSVLVTSLFYRVSVANAQRTPPEFINWLPITDVERQMKTPAIDKDAGAEVLLWRVHVVDDFVGGDLKRVFFHFVWGKGFDPKGKQQGGTVGLAFSQTSEVPGWAGRPSTNP